MLHIHVRGTEKDLGYISSRKKALFLRESEQSRGQNWVVKYLVDYHLVTTIQLTVDCDDAVNLVTSHFKKLSNIEDVTYR